MGVDIKRKGKVEKSDRVCRKDEKGTRESKGSIKKSIEGDKATR